MKNLLPSTTHPRTEIQTSAGGFVPGILLEIHPLGYWKSLFTTSCLTKGLALNIHAWRVPASHCVLQLLSGGRPSLGGWGLDRSIRPCCRSLMLEKLPVLKKLWVGMGESWILKSLSNLVH